MDTPTIIYGVIAAAGQLISYGALRQQVSNTQKAVEEIKATINELAPRQLASPANGESRAPQRTRRKRR